MRWAPLRCWLAGAASPAAGWLAAAGPAPGAPWVAPPQAGWGRRPAAGCLVWGLPGARRSLGWSAECPAPLLVLPSCHSARPSCLAGRHPHRPPSPACPRRPCARRPRPGNGGRPRRRRRRRRRRGRSSGSGSSSSSRCVCCVCVCVCSARHVCVCVCSARHVCVCVRAPLPACACGGPLPLHAWLPSPSSTPLLPARARPAPLHPSPLPPPPAPPPLLPPTQSMAAAAAEGKDPDILRAAGGQQDSAANLADLGLQVGLQAGPGPGRGWAGPGAMLGVAREGAG